MFLGVTKRCICECSEDIQACLSFSVNVVCVLPECHPPIESHSKDGGGVNVWNGGVVKCDPGFCIVFLCPGCDECECRFGGGDLESVCVEPLFKYVDVLLKVCGGGLRFRVLCVYGDVVGV